MQAWFLSVQREWRRTRCWSWLTTGITASRLPIIADYNQAFPNLPGQTLGVQARRPIPDFGAITWLDPAGNNNYNGLSARFEHRFGWRSLSS